jgi:hypothetical protein
LTVNFASPRVSCGSAAREEVKFAVDIRIGKLTLVIVDDHGSIGPMRDVALDVADHRRNVDLLEENVLDLNERAIGDSRLSSALQIWIGISSPSCCRAISSASASNSSHSVWWSKDARRLPIDGALCGNEFALCHRMG